MVPASHSRSPAGPDLDQPARGTPIRKNTYQVEWYLLATHAALLDRTQTRGTPSRKSTYQVEWYLLATHAALMDRT
jgi:hypothetical protein